MSEELKAIFRRLNDEAWNEGNFDLIDDLVSRDLVLHLLDGTRSSFEAYKDSTGSVAAAWSDSNFTIDHMIAEGDMLAAHWTYRATHTGPMRELYPAPPAKRRPWREWVSIVSRTARSWRCGESMICLVGSSSSA